MLGVEKQNIFHKFAVNIVFCLSLPSVVCRAIKYLSTLSHKRPCFRKKIMQYKKCVLIFSTILSKKFLILKIIYPDVIINVHPLSVKF
jgi:hypothetical protein